MVEPLPGTEIEYNVIAGVSSFLVLLDKLSAALGDDDDSALVSRKDIATIWWGIVLRRTVLGLSSSSSAAEEGVGGAGSRTAASLDRNAARGRKATTTSTPKKGKEVATSTKPLIVSRAAMTAAVRMLVWGMTRSESYLDDSNRDRMTAFGVVIFNEYEERAEAMLKGLDRRYGVRNLEECIVGWAGKSPKVSSACLRSKIPVAETNSWTKRRPSFSTSRPSSSTLRRPASPSFPSSSPSFLAIPQNPTTPSTPPFSSPSSTYPSSLHPPRPFRSH